MNGFVHYLVLGSGSIARRHIANLKILFPDGYIGCISSSGKLLNSAEIGANVVYSSLKEAMKYPIMFAVIATPAPFHMQQAAELLDNNVPVLIEKPMADGLASYKKVMDLLHIHQDKVEVAYNLRYMPSAICLKQCLEQQILGKICSITIDVGQYLPDWRPAISYKHSVSANKALGGGVLLELSHELDYLIWLFGDFTEVFCVITNSRTLDIDVEDSIDAIFIRHDGVIANVHMDFLQHKPSRVCKIIGELGTMEWELLTNQIVLTLKNKEKKLLFDGRYYDKNTMYLDELSHFAKVATGALKPKITMIQGLKVLYLVEAMKCSAIAKQMVTIGDNYL